MKQRLDQTLANRKMVASRSQAESYIRLGKVLVNGKVAQKTGLMVLDSDDIQLTAAEQYVSRAALKLASITRDFQLNFSRKTVLDIGSSTGGFTDFALRNGARLVLAVDVGTDQLHPSLRSDPRIELHEQTDIRNFKTTTTIDIIVADVSFISLREILPSVLALANPDTQWVIMVKPQFEAGHSDQKHKGVIKNDKMRRQILKDFEDWARKQFVIMQKADSQVAGSHGNVERFYLLKALKR